MEIMHQGIPVFFHERRDRNGGGGIMVHHAARCVSCCTGSVADRSGGAPEELGEGGIEGLLVVADVRQSGGAQEFFDILAGLLPEFMHRAGALVRAGFQAEEAPAEPLAGLDGLADFKEVDLLGGTGECDATTKAALGVDQARRGEIGHALREVGVGHLGRLRDIAE